MSEKRGLKDRIEAATAYFLCGFNSVKAAQICSVPARTIREWTDTEWWPDLITQVKREKQDELDSIMTKIIHKGTEKSLERLDIGDPYVMKDGTVGFKPVTAKDATMVTAILVDKRAMIRGEPIRRTEIVSEGSKLRSMLDDLNKPQEAEERPEKGSDKGVEHLH